MKKITLILFALFMSWQMSAQTIVIGSETTITGTYEITPIHGYYKNFRYQVVYTAAELSASLTPYDEITALGFSIAGDYGGGDLLNYTIKIGHTNATNCAVHINTPSVVVKDPFNYNPTVTAAGEFDMINFDTNFVWNGVDNIVIDICSDGPNPFTSPYGQVRASTTSNSASRYNRSDTTPGNACGTNTNNVSNVKPNIQFDYIDGTPPTCAEPAGLGVENTTFESVDLVWTSAGTLFDIEYGEAPFSLGNGTILENKANGYTLGGLSPETSYQYYVRQDCESETSTWSGPYTFFTGYCIPSASVYPSSYIINGVSTLGGYTNINNVTGANASANSYGNFSDFAVTQSPGGEFSYSVVVPSYTNVEIWADLNQNLVFEANELIGTHDYLTSGPVTFSGTILLPADIELGDYRIRVRSRYYYQTTADPCADANYGEIEDYTLSVVAPPSCLPPTGLTTGIVTFESADLSWTSEGTSFDVEWAEAPFSVGGGTLLTVSTNSVTLPELDPDTTYQYYVRQNCSTSDVSLWSGPFSFFTGYCAVSTTSTYEYTSAFSTSGAVSNVTYTATAQPAGSYANLVDNIIEQAQGLSFDFASTYVGGGQKVNIWIDWDKNLTFDNTTGSTEKVYSQYNSAANQSGNIEIPATVEPGTYRMRVRSEWGSTANPPPCGSVSYGSTIDFTLEVLPAPSCFPPTVLVAENITLESADLSWVSEGTSFDLEWAEAPFEIGGGTLEENIANNFTLGGLNPDTKYQYYVRQRCGNDTSFWAGPYNFLTGYCVVSTLYTGDYTSAFTTSGAISNVEYTAAAQPLGSYVNLTDDVIEQAQGLSFDFSTTYVGGSNAVNIWIDWNNDLTFDNSTGSIEKVFTQIGINGATRTGNIEIPSDVEPGAYRMRVRSQYGIGVDPAPCGVVNYGTTLDYTLQVLPAPTCFPPTALGVENTTFESAVLTWTSTGTEFDIEWSEAPFAIGGGTLLENKPNNYLLEGLEAETAYQYYVRQDCGTEESYWSGPYSFYTGYCLPAASTYPSSYIINGVSTLDGYTNISNPTGTTPSEGSYGNFSDLSVSQSPGGEFSYSVVVPAYTNVEVWIDLNQNLVFDADELVDAYTYLTTGPVTFTGTIALPTDLPLGDYRLRVRSRYYFGTTASPCAGADYGEVEDYTLSIIAPPSCMPPSALGISNLTATSVDLSWTSDGTSFEVQYGEAPFQLGEGTIVSTTTNPFTLTPLNESTTYQYYVRQNCEASANGFSLWAGPFTFTTVTPGQIGDGDGDNSYFPIYSCYGYNYSQQIYLASELTGTLEPNATLITEIRFKPTSLPGSPANFTDWVVYLGNTSQNLFANSTSWISADNMEEVFSGQLTFGANEWVSIVLDTPFAWDGISNLVVGIDENTAGYSCTAQWASFNAGSNRGILYYDDTTNPNPSSPPAAEYGPNMNIAQIQFAAEVDLSTGNFENNSFTAYPNPVKDILNVSFKQNISNVTVYNLLGQQVLLMNMNANKGQVDMSALASGTYLVKVNSDSGVNTIKVIKE